MKWFTDIHQPVHISETRSSPFDDISGSEESISSLLNVLGCYISMKAEHTKVIHPSEAPNKRVKYSTFISWAITVVKLSRKSLRQERLHLQT